MASLKINSGLIVLDVEDEYGNFKGKFSFNPNDIESAKAVVSLQSEIDLKSKEFEEASSKCQNADERIDLMLEILDYFEQKIDEVFGTGSSELLFGDTKTFEMLESFFEGITPYYQKASEARMAKYKQIKKSGK